METFKNDASAILTDAEKMAKNVIKNSTEMAIEKITILGYDVVENLTKQYGDKYDDIELLFQKASRDFGINSGKLIKVLMINDNPYADVVLTVKSVFDLILVSVSQVLSVIYVVFYNKTYDEIEELTSKFFILDDFIIHSFLSLENGITNLFINTNKRAMDALFNWVEMRIKSQKKNSMNNTAIIKQLDDFKTKIQKTTKTIVGTFISEFFDSFTKDFQKKRGKIERKNKDIKSLLGGRLKTMRRRKSALLKRVRGHINDYNNTNKTFRRRMK